MSIGRLAIVAALLMVATAGCSRGSPDSGSTTWAALNPPSRDTIDEAERQVGFRLMLPSYLPPQMEAYTFQRTDHPAAPPSGPDESVTEASVDIGPLPRHMDQRSTGIYSISITEWKRRAGEPDVDLPVEDNMTIGGTAVTCHLEPNDALWVTPSPGVVDIPGLAITPGPTINPDYICGWDAGALRAQIVFSWQLPEPLVGLITSEMREEAIKVVRSMIEDPYRP